MREGRLVARVGALVLGAGLVIGMALPAAAQETASAQAPDSDVRAVADSTQSFVETIVEVDPQEAFTDAFLACVAEFSVGDCTEEVLEDLALEDQEVGETTDNTPLNPVDDEGSLETPDDVELGALPPV